MQKLVCRLNEIYRSEPALFALDDCPEGFEWIDFHDAENTVWSFLRKAPTGSGASDLLVIVNATPVVRHGYRVGAPKRGLYQEILNSDQIEFGGSGAVKNGSRLADDQGAHARPCSLVLDLPPLSVTILRLPSA